MNTTYSADRIIAHKRDGGELTREQTNWFVQGLLNGKVGDHQASALLMAIYLNGCSKAETYNLTRSMLASGTVLDFQTKQAIDKHSTGGVGDKTSLILGPIAAAAGVTVPMISGRGLGHTGGTIDKLESIPGFNCTLALDQFLSVVSKVGIAIVGQSEDLAPADKILYGLRDVTATVDSIPLIASSIMSKKLAAGSSGLVMDIKTGPGAFMKTKSEARKLARTLKETARAFDKSMITLITDMSQPLGIAIGNSNEVIESIETLKGKGPEDVTTLSVELAACMIYLAGLCPSMKSARKLAMEQITSGKALLKFKEMILAQGGDPRVLTDYSLLPQAGVETRVLASGDGFVAEIKAEQLGQYVCLLGGGRTLPADKVDHSVGILNHVKIGDFVKEGDLLCTLRHHPEQKVLINEILPVLQHEVYKIKSEKPIRLPNLIEEIDLSGIGEKR